jgi:hypothetical protein
MTQYRNVAIAAGVLALVGLGAAVHYSSTARAAQPLAPTAQANPDRTYPDSLAPAAAPALPDTTANPSTVSALGSPGAVAMPVAASTGTGVVYRDRIVYRRASSRPARYYVHRRSSEHSAEIIGGSALAGAGLGALVGGGKGALVGGLVGGAGGTVYDRTTRKKVVRE